jgi:hypothetical protein
MSNAANAALKDMDAFSSCLGAWLTGISVPQRLWPILLEKLKAAVFDAGASFSIAAIDHHEGDGDETEDHRRSDRAAFALVAQRDIQAFSDVWLLDHCWTFPLRDCRSMLERNDDLRDRILTMISGKPSALRASAGGSCDDEEAKNRVREDEALWVYNNMWRLARSYKAKRRSIISSGHDESGDGEGRGDEEEIRTDDEFENLWFFLDEVGSAIWPSFKGNKGRNGFSDSFDDDDDDDDDEDGDDEDLVGAEANLCIATLPLQFSLGPAEQPVCLSIAWPKTDISAGTLCGTDATTVSGDETKPDDSMAPLPVSFVVKRSPAAATLLYGSLRQRQQLLASAVAKLDGMLSAHEAAQRLGDARLLGGRRRGSSVAAASPASAHAVASASSFSSSLSANSSSFSGGGVEGLLSGSSCVGGEGAPAELPDVIPFYTDSKLVATFVTSPRFRLVEDPLDAVVMWLLHHPMKRSDDFPHARIVSQFPEERFFTNKQMLARVLHGRIGQPEWLATTYDATTELEEFIADFTARETVLKRSQHGEDDEEDVIEAQRLLTRLALLRPPDGTNLWIAKPTNLARSIGMTVSDNLECLLRAVETDPKILCKYISNPCTLRGRKFDLRFVVALRSLSTANGGVGLKAFLYNVFWTRFAAEKFDLKDFDMYDKHFTVMNYGGRTEKLLQLHYDAFILEFEREYPLVLWSRDVYPKIRSMIREAFAGLPSDPIPHERFRGVYGIDVMLSVNPGGQQSIMASVASSSSSSAAGTCSISIDPTLLEITYSPDCHRACKYHPSFMNDVFHTLIAGDAASAHNFTLL